ncbi:MAG: peptidylprolyl isomerase, partial [Gemmatimonadaceae bacterium]|nr:peptidylprolyl isomerase [Gemmatimonadaceae bacterium]
RLRPFSRAALLWGAFAPPVWGLGGGAAPRDLPVDRVVAVVGSKPIMWSEVQELINFQRQQGAQIPEDSAGFVAFARDIISDLVDQEVLIATAKGYKIDVTDAEVLAQVDGEMKRIRDQFKSEQEFRDALKGEGFGTVEELRKVRLDRAKRDLFQQRAIDSLKAKGRMPTVAISEAEITDAFEKAKDRLPQRPATVTFRQIIVSPTPTEASKKATLAKMDSLRKEIASGVDFEVVAKRESQDQGSKDLGGDLGWNRRGMMVPAFDQMMFALAPNVVSPTVETVFGAHLIRVDRIRPAEVKARHILLRWKMDSSDVQRARVRADTVLAQWEKGVPFDSLVAKYHDDAELRLMADPVPRDSLPAEYRAAIADKKAGDFAGPFLIPNPQNGLSKAVVLQLTSVEPGGPMKISDVRERIRAQLLQEKTARRILDQLRKEMYVSIRM